MEKIIFLINARGGARWGEGLRWMGAVTEIPDTNSNSNTTLLTV